MRPSFLAQIMNGLLFFIAIVIYLQNYKEIDTTNTIIIITLLSVTIGIHGILHHYEELNYDWNPLENKWIPK